MATACSQQALGLFHPRTLLHCPVERALYASLVDDLRLDFPEIVFKFSDRLLLPAPAARLALARERGFRMIGGPALHWCNGIRPP